MKKRNVLFMVLSFLVVFVFCSCQNNQSAQVENQENVPLVEFDYTIGFLVSDLSNERCNVVERSFAANIPENYELLVHDASGNPDTQIKQMNQLIGAGVDGIILCPCDFEAGKTVVAEASKAGIPIIVSGIIYSEGDITVENGNAFESTDDSIAEESQDSDIMEDSADAELNAVSDDEADTDMSESSSGAESTETPEEVSYIVMPDAQVAYDYSEIAYSAMQYVAQNIENANVLYCHCGNDNQIYELYQQGAEKAIDEYPDKITMAGIATGLKSGQDVYERIMELLDNNFAQFNVIFIDDDCYIQSVLQAVTDSTATGITLIGAGGSETGCKALLSGNMAADVIAPANIEGKQLADFCISCVEKQNIENTTEKLMPKLINTDNISDWIHWDNFMMQAGMLSDSLAEMLAY